MFFLTIGCFFDKTYKKSSIVGATINDHEATVEIREEHDENGNVIKKNHNHPYYFTESGLANILSSVYYTERGWLHSEGRRQLFRQEELQKIMPPIINAFSMTNESQDILVYSTSHKVLLSDKQCYFSMFVMESELYIVFSTIENKKSYSDGKSKLKNKSKLKEPLDVKKSSFWKLLPMGGQRLAKGHENRLIIDLNSNLFGVAGTTDTEDSNSVDFGSSASAVKNRIITDSGFIEEKNKYQNVREKLKELKDLKENSLISEEDYEKKKNELLRNF